MAHLFRSSCRLFIVLMALSLMPLVQGQDVSKDLIELYETTSRLTTEKDFTTVVDRCFKAIGDSRRSKADSAYASQLLAWAANKRGEWKSDQAGELVSQGKTDQAARLDRSAAEDFLLALEHDPNRWRARHNYAVSLAMQKKYSAAISEFSQVIEQNPKYSNAFFNRGELYFQRREFDLAIADFTAAIQLSPKDSQSYCSRGHAKFMLEQFDSAIADYRTASQLDPKNAALATDYADACQSLFRWKEATEGYRRALTADEHFVRSLQNAAWMLATCPDAKFRNAGEALELAEKASELDGERSFRQWDVLSVCQAANGDFKKAIESANRALESASEEDAAEVKDRIALFRKKRAYLQVVDHPAETKNTTIRTANRAVGTGVHP